MFSTSVFFWGRWGGVEYPPTIFFGNVGGCGKKKIFFPRHPHACWLLGDGCNTMSGEFSGVQVPEPAEEIDLADEESEADSEIVLD